MILKDASNSVGPIEVARKELPYSFDVRSPTPWTNGPTSHHTERANISSSGGICHDQHPGPAATTHSEDSTFGIDTLCISPTSDAGAQPILDRNSGSNRVAGQRTPPTGCPSPMGPLVLHPPRESPHIPTDAEKDRARARIAEREVQINALEMKIRELKATFEADSQVKYAAIKDHFSTRVLAIQREFADRLNDVLSRAPSGSDRQGRDWEVFPCPQVKTLGTRYSH